VAPTIKGGGDFVVADRAPVAADPALVQVRQQQQGDQRHRGADPGLPSGQREVGAEETRSSEDHVKALVTAEGPGPGQRDRRERDAEQEGRARQVRAAQPGRGDAYHGAGHGRDRARDHQHEVERPAEVEQQQGGGVGADGHERAVAQRDLAAEPGQHGEPGDGRDIDRDLRDLVVAERVQLDGQEHDDRGHDDGHAEPAG